MKTKPSIYIWSIGHSNKSMNTFIDELKENKIEVLVDVRTTPLSRFCPHFNKNALQRTLSDETIKYLWRGRNLGGKGINVDYNKAIEELSFLARKGRRVCVMCSEKDYEKCHRHTILAPSFEERGVLMLNIKYKNLQ